MHAKNPKPTYSIILMRDDCNVSAFRLHSFWVKFFCVFIVALAGVCAVGGYGAFYYKNLYEIASAESRELHRALGESTIRLENLANERVVGSFTGVSGEPDAPGEQAMPGYSQEPGASHVPPTPEDLGRLLDQPAPEHPEQPDRPVSTEAQMDQHPVRVSNLKAVFESDDRLRITYDLSNQQPGTTLVGRCNISLLMSDGELVDITPSARGVLTFQIARFRKMDLLAQLPAAVARDNIVKIQVSAKANDLPLYYKQFPLEENAAD